MENIDENSSENSTPENSQRRKTLCELLDEVEDMVATGSTSGQTADDAGDIIKKIRSLIAGEDLYTRLKRVDETMLDVRILSTASNVLQNCIQAADLDHSTYDFEEYADNIIAICDRSLTNLANQLTFVSKHLASKSLYGTQDLNVKPTPKEKPQRSQRTKVEYERKEPEKVTEFQKEERGIEDIVKYLEDVLIHEYTIRGKEPLNYYDYLIDIDDFGQTVENFFYFTFLLRDGKARLDLDSKNNVLVTPANKAELRQFQNEGSENIQIVSSISMDEWKSFKKSGFLQKYRKNPQLLNRRSK